MKVINIQLLSDFSRIYPDASVPLDAWLQVAKQARWRYLMDIKATWSRSTDYVEGKTVFNIGGNKYRLITTINYKLGIVKIDKILTHKQYDTGNWKKE